VSRVPRPPAAAFREQFGRHWPLLQLLTLAVLVLTAGAAGRELHGTPTFYASLIRELVESGDLLHIFRGDEAYLLKPPLTLWAGALASELFGLNNFSVTLLPRLAAIACVALTWTIVRELAGPRAAWVAGLVLLTNSTFVQFSSTLRMDSALLCGLLLVVAGWVCPRARWADAALFGGLCVGLLAKGPLVLFALPLCALWSAFDPAARARRPEWRWGVLLLPAVAWYGFVFAEHGTQQVSDLGADLVRPNPDGASSAWASYYGEYFLRPAQRYWPWLPFFLLGLVMAARPPRHMEAADSRALRWFAAWTLLVFVMLAFKPDRDIRYLYIALPGMAGLAAVPIARWLAGARFRHAVLVGTLLTAAVAVAAALGAGTRDTRPEIAAMRAGLAVAAPALDGRPPVMIGEYPLRPGQPRRQNSQRDWIHFYLGVVPRIVPWSEVKSGALAGEPVVFTIRAGDYTGALAALGFTPLAVSKEMVMAVPK
jgi:4-amino-4-deoxy-L-arabinose transferase-like glycosyltransferase